MDMERNNPNIDEVDARVEENGRLRGPVDWVFPAWMIYIEDKMRKIAKTFPLAEEEKRALLGFGDIMKNLLQRAHKQAKAKLASIYDAIDDGNYRLEEGKLYAPDGAWMYVSEEPYIVIEGIDAVAYFPDILKLPREKLELFQLGWEVHEEEGGGGHPAYTTADPSLFLAWAAVRFGEVHVAVTRALLLEDGVAVEVRATARSWRKRWTKKRGGKARGEVQKTRRVGAVPHQIPRRITTFFNPSLLNPLLLPCFCKPAHPPSGVGVAGYVRLENRLSFQLSLAGLSLQR